MEAEDSRSDRVANDAEWARHQPRLDRLLATAIRAPVVDERFDNRVWAMIRADEATGGARQRRVTLGPPWWLDCLNALAVAVTTVALALALRTAAPTPIAEMAAAATAFVDRQPDSLRSLALIGSAAALWLGLRHVPFVRALVRA